MQQIARVRSLVSDGGRTAAAVRAAGGLAAAVPLLLWLLALPAFGELQYNDYWGILGEVVEGRSVTGDPVDWLTLKSNEHTITLPALLYVANVAVARGDNRALSLLALGLLTAIVLLLWRTFARQLAADDPLRPLVAGFLAAVVFSPAATHSIVMGFSGSIWFLSNLFAVAAVVVLAAGGRSRAALWAALVLAVAGALSYSTNASLWPALLAGALLLRRRRREVAVVALTGVAVWTALALLYRRPPHHPEPQLLDPVGAAIHACIYLGSPFASDPRAAAGFGAALLAGSGWLVWRLLRRGADGAQVAAPWVMLQVYAAGNAVGTAVGRAGFGWAQALASRYVSVAVLFAVGAVGLLLAAAGRSGQHVPARERVAPVAALLLVLVVATVDRGLPVLDEYLERAAWQPLAAEAIRNGVWDDPSLLHVTPAPQEIAAVRPYLQSTRHRPFGAVEPPPPARVDVAPEPPAALWSDPPAVAVVRPGLARVAGWAVSAAGVASRVLLVDPAGRVMAELETGLPAPAARERFGRAARRAGWAGFVRLDRDLPSRVVVAAAFGDDPRLYPVATIPTGAPGP